MISQTVQFMGCICCPMLRVDPRQKGRLAETIGNLKDRIDEAGQTLRSAREALKLGRPGAWDVLARADCGPSRAARSSSAGPENCRPDAMDAILAPYGPAVVT